MQAPKQPAITCYLAIVLQKAKFASKD